MYVLLILMSLSMNLFAQEILEYKKHLFINWMIKHPECISCDHKEHSLTFYAKNGTESCRVTRKNDDYQLLFEYNGTTHEFFYLDIAFIQIDFMQIRDAFNNYMFTHYLSNP